MRLDRGISLALSCITFPHPHNRDAVVVVVINYSCNNHHVPICGGRVGISHGLADGLNNSARGCTNRIATHVYKDDHVRHLACPARENALEHVL